MAPVTLGKLCLFEQLSKTIVDFPTTTKPMHMPHLLLRLCQHKTEGICFRVLSWPHSSIPSHTPLNAPKPGESSEVKIFPRVRVMPNKISVLKGALKRDKILMARLGKNNVP